MIPDLQGLPDTMVAEKIADYFSDISNLYEKVDLSKLPSYLPSLPHPQVTEFIVYKKIKNLKNTRSTNQMDLPSKLRREYDVF